MVLPQDPSTDLCLLAPDGGGGRVAVRFELRAVVVEVEIEVQPARIEGRQAAAAGAQRLGRPERRVFGGEACRAGASAAAFWTHRGGRPDPCAYELRLIINAVDCFAKTF